MSADRDLDALVREMHGRAPLRASALLLTLIVLVGAAIFWASVTEIDDVTRAPGKVVPAGDVQPVQSAEEGVIREVFVTEGAIVAAGDPLVALDGVVQTSQFDRESQRVYALSARIERLNAEIEGRAPAFDETLVANAPEVVVSERALSTARTTEMKAELGVLERRLEQRRQEHAAAETALQTAQRQAGLLEEERDILAPLVARGIEPRTTLLGLGRDEEEIRGRIATADRTWSG